MLKRRLVEEEELVDITKLATVQCVAKKAKPQYEEEPQINMTFDASDFRQKLQKGNIEEAIKDLFFITSDQNIHKDSHIDEYFAAGGSCLELFQIFEFYSNSPEDLIRICAQLIFAVMERHAPLESATEEACRYMINTHLVLINQMLNISSTLMERWSILRLLTAMVTLSTSLVKPILLNVAIHTKLLVRFEANMAFSVRMAFIDFVMSFFVAGNMPCVLQFVEHPYLLQNMMPGLRYDPAPTVNIVLTTIKKYLIDIGISKDARVKLFSNTAVKGLVYLYDWRGPNCFNEERQMQTDGYVDDVAQQEIAANAHQILIVLCSGIWKGIVFRDESLGTGTIHRNPLMYNIVDMSFDGNMIGELHQDLIVRMAIALPDMVKTIWAKLLPSLEPRIGGNWEYSMQFVRRLISRLQPYTTIKFAHQFKPMQYAQIVQIMVTPTLVLQKFIPRDFCFPTVSIKRVVTKTILEILRAVSRFLKCAKTTLPDNYYRTLFRLLQDHVQRHMPNANYYLADEENQRKEANHNAASYVDYMGDVVHITELYHEMCPDLLESAKFKHLAVVLKIEFDSEKEELILKGKQLKIDVINALSILEPSMFHVTGVTLGRSIGTLASYLIVEDTSEDNNVENIHQRAYKCICTLLNLTGLFTECQYEVETWVDYLQDANMCKYFCWLLRQAFEKNTEIQAELHELRTATGVELTMPAPEETRTDVDGILQRLSSDNYTPSTVVKSMKVNAFSNMIVLAVRQYPGQALADRLSQVLLNVFHLQTNHKLFTALVQKYQSNVTPFLGDYVTNCSSEKYTLLDKLPDTPLYTTAAAIFKLVHLQTANDYCAKVISSVQKYAAPMLDMFYCNPNILSMFQLWNDDPISEYCVTFLTDVTCHLKDIMYQEEDEDTGELNVYLKPFQRRIFNCILNTGKRVQSQPQSKKKFEQIFSRVVSAFGMSYDECLEIIQVLSKQPHEHFLAEDSKKGNQNYYSLVTVVAYCAELCKTMDPDNTRRLQSVKEMFHLLSKLKKCGFDTIEMAQSMLKYVENFDLTLLSDEKVLRDYVDTDIQSDIYNLSNTELIVKIVKSLDIPNSCLSDFFEQNLSYIVKRKGLCLSLLDVVTLDDRIAAATYEQLLPQLELALAKPEKAGSAFSVNYKGFCSLVSRQVDLEFVKARLDTVQKSKVTEIFYVAILEALFLKYMKSNEAKTDPQIKHYAQNAVMTFARHIMRIIKNVKQKCSDEEEGSNAMLDAAASADIDSVTQMLANVIDALPPNASIKMLRQDDNFKRFCKLCLKHGIGDKQVSLLKTLAILAKKMKFSLEECTEYFEMLMAHSKFMDIALEYPSMAKLAVFDLVYALCKTQPTVMNRKHVPILLASYSATMHPSDRRVLSLLYSYEEHREQTMIYDFKPFLWGQAAATFYTLRSGDARGLAKQPRTGDLLDILQPDMIESTIVNFPRNTVLDWNPVNIGIDDEESMNIYDVGFILSVLTQILSNEYVLVTHKLTRSGAIALVAIALSAQNANTRTAACHVLAKIYYHLEGNRYGKDFQMWLRYIEVLAKGVGAAVNHKLNGFAALFMARTAIAIANPKHPMYGPLSNFLSVKEAPNLNKIPELHTFLNAPHVDYLRYRHFILQLMHDGLRSDADYTVAFASRALKLIMDLFNSHICDGTSRELIIKIVERAVVFPHACRAFCNSTGFSAWLSNVGLTLIDSLLLERIENIYNMALKHNGMEVTMTQVAIATEQIKAMLDDYEE